MTNTLLAFIETITPGQFIALYAVHFLISLTFCILWMTERSRNSPRIDNKGSYGANAGQTRYEPCHVCNSESHRIIFGCCSDCFIELHRAIGQTVDLSGMYDATKTQTIKVKPAIAKTEED